jgi:glyoxylase-like metal-dependent hydrolase (beta-lactamase superfamily II)
MSGLAPSASNNADAASIHLMVFTSPYHQIGSSEDRTFSPVTSTILYGVNDAVLVDAQYIREDIDALCDMIDATGRRLTTIYITHAHADHYFGIDRILERFPGSRAVATKAVVDYLTQHSAAEFKQFSGMFGDELVLPTSLPTPLDDGFIVLEDERLRIVEVGQGDIPHSTVLHVPSIDAVIAGDVVYNGIHQMLGLGGPTEWRKWLESVDKVESLRPRTVIAGHKRPGASDEAAPVLEATRSYIRDFAEAVGVSASARDVVTAMRSKYPDHGNLTTLLFSASAAIKARET